MGHFFGKVQIQRRMLGNLSKTGMKPHVIRHAVGNRGLKIDSSSAEQHKRRLKSVTAGRDGVKRKE